MSFIGTIRPLVKGNATVRPDPWPALLLAGGFVVSAGVVFAVVWWLGAGLLGGWRGSVVVLAAAAALLLVLAVADAEWFGLRTPMWRRQTPKWFQFRFGDRVAALLWGLDAGIVGTTFRVTSLSWAALVLAFAGLVPWWAGGVYAAGFAVPELIADLLIPRRRRIGGHDDPVDPEPTWLTERLLRLRPVTRPAGLVLLGAAGVWSLVLAATT